MNDKLIQIHEKPDDLQDCSFSNCFIEVGTFAIPVSMIGEPSSLDIAKVQEAEHQERVRRFRKYWTGAER